MFSKFLYQNSLVAQKTIITQKNIILGNGSTELYNSAVESILYHEGRKTVGRNIIIIPTPTYGLFINQIKYKGGEVALIELQEKYDYKLTPHQLSDAIEKINHAQLTLERESIQHRIKEIFFLLRKKNSSITEPEVNFKSSLEAEKRLDEIQITINDIKKSHSITEDLPILLYPSRVVGFLFINPHNPTGSIYTQKNINELANITKQFDLSIIADSIHQFINPNNFQDIGSFGMIEEIKKMYIITSPSKHLGAAALRLGMMYITSDIRHIACDIAYHNSMFVGYPKEKQIKIAYNQIPEWYHYVTENNRDYFYRQQMVKLLIEGNQNLDYLANLDNIFITSNAKDEFIRLIRGLPRVSQLKNPDASFFSVLDFSKWKGYELNGVVLNTSMQFCAAIEFILNMTLLPNEGMCFPNQEKILFRFNQE